MKEMHIFRRMFEQVVEGVHFDSVGFIHLRRRAFILESGSSDSGVESLMQNYVN